MPETAATRGVRSGDVISCIPPTSAHFRWDNYHLFDLFIINQVLQDPLTGEIQQIFRTPYKKAHRIGGTLPV